MSVTARKCGRLKSPRAGAALWRWLVLAVATLVSSVAAIASEPKISVAPIVKAEVSSQTDFYIHIDWSTTAAPPNSLLIVVGLPKSVTFSAGNAAGSLWELPLTDLEKLKITVPPIEPKKVNLGFYLVNKQQGGIVILASTRSVLALETSTRSLTSDARAPNDTNKAEKSPQAAPLEGKPLAGAVYGPERQPSVAASETVLKENDLAAKETLKQQQAAEERVGQANKALGEARAKVAAKHAEAERLTAEAGKVEQAREAEEAKLEGARRHVAAQKAEAERLAAETAKVEQARKTEEARIEEARRQVAAQKAEAERLTAEAARVEEARKTAEARVEEARRQIAAQKAEAERRAAEAAKVEEARKAEEARAEDVRRQAAAKQAEVKRLTAEAARKAEEARVEDVRRQAAAKQAEAGRLAAIAAEKKVIEVASAAKAPVAEPKGSDGLATANTAGDKPERLSVPAQSERFLKKGDEYLSQGNVAIAREYFLRAARSGVAIAALKLAETYDPHELGRMNVHGLVPNIAEARRWYLRALELGSDEAGVRLVRMGN